MSWFSEFVHHPSAKSFGKIFSNPLYDLGGIAALAAPFLLPELGGALGLGAAAEGGGAALGAEALGAEGIGGLGAAEGLGGEAALGAAEGGSGLDALLGGAAFDEAALPTSATLTSGTSEGLGLGSLDSMFPGGALGGGSGGAPLDVLASSTGGNSAASSASTSFLDKLLQGATNQVTKNPLGIATGIGGLGLSFLNQKPAPEMGTIKNSASFLGMQGQQLAQYLQNGTLPPGLKAAVDQASASAKARIVSNHAANGMSTDPNQNSALAQELSSADQNAVMMTAQIGQQLLTTGINEIGLSTQLYEYLMKMDQANSDRIGKAIMNFASAMGGGFKQK